VREGGHERSPNQLEELFCDLGPMPPAEDCDDRAMWVAAMINPLPALGVAYEIRPAVLTAQSPTTRLQVRQAPGSHAQLPPGGSYMAGGRVHTPSRVWGTTRCRKWSCSTYHRAYMGVGRTHSASSCVESRSNVVSVSGVARSGDPPLEKLHRLDDTLAGGAGGHQELHRAPQRHQAAVLTDLLRPSGGSRCGGHGEGGEAASQWLRGAFAWSESLGCVSLARGVCREESIASIPSIVRA